MTSSRFISPAAARCCTTTALTPTGRPWSSTRATILTLDFTGFTCWSWLLDPSLAKILPPESNIVQFQQDFHLLPVPANEAQCYDLVFGQGQRLPDQRDSDDAAPAGDQLTTSGPATECHAAAGIITWEAGNELGLGVANADRLQAVLFSRIARAGNWVIAVWSIHKEESSMTFQTALSLLRRTPSAALRPSRATSPESAFSWCGGPTRAASTSAPARRKPVCQQIKANPKMELCFYKPGPDPMAPGAMMRVAGSVEFVDDVALRTELLNEWPFLKQMGITGPEDPMLSLIRDSLRRDKVLEPAQSDMRRSTRKWRVLASRRRRSILSNTSRPAVRLAVVSDQ